MATVGQYEQERGIAQDDPAALIRSLLVDMQQQGSLPVAANSASAYQDFMAVLDRPGAVRIVDSSSAGFAIMLIPRLVDNNTVVIDYIMVACGS
jgi:hypothetical protein